MKPGDSNLDHRKRHECAELHNTRCLAHYKVRCASVAVHQALVWAFSKSLVWSSPQVAHPPPSQTVSLSVRTYFCNLSSQPLHHSLSYQVHLKLFFVLSGNIKKWGNGANSGWDNWSGEFQGQKTGSLYFPTEPNWDIRSKILHWLALHHIWICVWKLVEVRSHSFSTTHLTITSHLGNQFHFFYRGAAHTFLTGCSASADCALTCVQQVSGLQASEHASHEAALFQQQTLCTLCSLWRKW